MILIDATNTILGRMAAYAAKYALEGNKVVIVNCEKAYVSGSKQDVFADYLNRLERGTPRKGPFIHRMPDKLVRRTIRGMLPYKKAKGREAYKRVLCFVGVPEEYKNEKPIELDNKVKIEKLPTLKYVDLLTLSRRLGAKI
ncbi:MAG: 50S ribosomal protein L13 [Candidatus Woesearchaeota archaeon]